MKIFRLEDNGGRKVIRFETLWSEIEADYQDIVSRYANVRVPGFRPGRAPHSVVERRFQKEITEDLSARIVERFGKEAVQETGAGALGPLEVSEIQCKRGNSFRAVVRYLPMPEFQLPDIHAMKAKNAGPNAYDRISRDLIERIPFAVPSELVRRELDLDGLGESDADSQPWRAATERIRLMIILKKIARQEGIEVDEEDVNKRIREKAEEWQESPAALRSKLEASGGIARLRDMLLAEKTLEYLVEAKKEES